MSLVELPKSLVARGFLTLILVTVAMHKVIMEESLLMGKPRNTQGAETLHPWARKAPAHISRETSSTKEEQIL